MMSSLCLSVVALSNVMPAAPPGLGPSTEPAQKRVLVLAIEPKGTKVTRDMCDLLTSAVTAEAAKMPGHKVVAMKEVEGLIGQEQARELAGCDAAGCAAELAGALNVEEVMMGNLGSFGDNYILTLTRIQARTAVVLGRSVQRFSGQGESEILDRLPAVVAEAFGLPAPAVPHVAPPPTGPVAKVPPPMNVLETSTVVHQGGHGASLPWVAMFAVGVAGVFLVPVPVVILGLASSALGVALALGVAAGLGDVVGIVGWAVAIGIGGAAGAVFLAAAGFGALKAWVL